MAFDKILENKNISSILCSVDYIIKETRESLNGLKNWVGLYLGGLITG